MELISRTLCEFVRARELELWCALLSRITGDRAFGLGSILSVLQAIIALTTYLIVMRLVIGEQGIEVVGLWSLTMGFVAIFRIIDFSGAHALSRTVAMRGSDEAQQAKDVDTLSLFIAAFYGAVIVVGFLPARELLKHSIGSPLEDLASQLMIWTAIALPLNILGLAHSSALDGIGRAAARAKINICGYLIFGAFSFLVIKPFGIIGVAYAQVLQYSFVLIATRYTLQSLIPVHLLLPRGFDKFSLKELLSYSVRLQLASLPSAIFIPVSRIGLNSAAGLETLGYFDLAYRVSISTRALLQSALNPILPEFTRLIIKGGNEARALYIKIENVFLPIIVLAFSSLMAAAPLISFILTGTVDPSLVSFILLLSVAWGVSTTFLLAQIFARAKGYLRWSIAGQWAMVGFLAIFVLSAALADDPNLFVIGIVIAILAGHIVTGAIEMHKFGILPRRGRAASFLLANAILMAAFFVSDLFFSNLF